jgi:aspartate 1-decarboxylase
MLPVLEEGIPLKLKSIQYNLPMNVQMLRSKIHRLTVTDAHLDYQGSITLDRNLMNSSGILEHEKVQVVNVTNGERFETYVIPGPENSGVVCVNGAAAHLAKAGHIVIVMAFASMPLEAAKSFQPVLVMVDEKNHIKTAATVL